ncbi:20460_t:CDS:2, partial [Funneliformis geosporum]
TVTKENSENEKVLEQLLKEFKEEKVKSLKLSEADKQNKIYQYKGYFARLERNTFEFDIFASVATFPVGAFRAKYQLIEASDDSDRTLTLKNVEGTKTSNLGHMMLEVYRVRGIVKEFFYRETFDNDKGEAAIDSIDKLDEIGESLPFPIASEELDFNDYDSDSDVALANITKASEAELRQKMGALSNLGFNKLPASALAPTRTANPQQSSTSFDNSSSSSNNTSSTSYSNNNNFSPFSNNEQKPFTEKRRITVMKKQQKNLLLLTLSAGLGYYYLIYLPGQEKKAQEERQRRADEENRRQEFERQQTEQEEERVSLIGLVAPYVFGGGDNEEDGKKREEDRKERKEQYDAMMKKQKPNRAPEEEAELANLRKKLRELENQQENNNSKFNPLYAIVPVGIIAVLGLILVFANKKRK